MGEREPQTLSEAILMALDSWRIRAEGEMPAVVYAITREAYRYGQRASVPQGSDPPPELRGVLENIYHGWLDLAAERALAGKPAPSATEAANTFAVYAAPLVRAALRAGPPGEPSESYAEWTARMRAMDESGGAATP